MYQHIWSVIGSLIILYSIFIVDCTSERILKLVNSWRSSEIWWLVFYGPGTLCHAWNILVDFITGCSSSDTFKHYRNTYLFSLSFWAHINTLVYDCVGCPCSSLYRLWCYPFTLHYMASSLWLVGCCCIFSDMRDNAEEWCWPTHSQLMLLGQHHRWSVFAFSCLNFLHWPHAAWTCIHICVFILYSELELFCFFVFFTDILIVCLKSCLQCFIGQLIGHLALACIKSCHETVPAHHCSMVPAGCLQVSNSVSFQCFSTVG